jgi:hypothetical protein
MTNIRGPKARVVVVLLLALGCTSVRVVDALLTLTVEGRVQDEQSRPVPGAQIALVDDGLDEKRRLRPKPLMLGVSDAEGLVSLTRDYLWGYEEPASGSSQVRSGSFKIVVTKDGFEPFVLGVQLPEVGPDHRVRLNAVLKSAEPRR